MHHLLVSMDQAIDLPALLGLDVLSIAETHIEDDGSVRVPVRVRVRVLVVD